LAKLKSLLLRLLGIVTILKTYLLRHDSNYYNNQQDIRTRITGLKLNYHNRRSAKPFKNKVTGSRGFTIVIGRSSAVIISLFNAGLYQVSKVKLSLK
jgi:hypothetical protein